MTFSSIYASVVQIYNYLKQRGGVKLIMQVKPTKLSVIDTIKKLGFEMTEIKDKQRKSRSKNWSINMEPKRE